MEKEFISQIKQIMKRANGIIVSAQESCSDYEFQILKTVSESLSAWCKKSEKNFDMAFANEEIYLDRVWGELSVEINKDISFSFAYDLSQLCVSISDWENLFSEDGQLFAQMARTTSIKIDKNSNDGYSVISSICYEPAETKCLKPLKFEIQRTDFLTKAKL